ncbi:MAG: DinB family protein [bacterium]
MSQVTIARPKADEHAEFYTRYVTLVPDGDLIALLRDQVIDTAALLREVGAERANYAYAPGKWTIKQVLGHMTDVERVMSYRALWFARNDSADLPGFDEDKWAVSANHSSRTLEDLFEEFQIVRAATIQFAKHVDAAASVRRGKANGQELSVRALLYIIAGHERHHGAVLRERYLTS